MDKCKRCKEVECIGKFCFSCHMELAKEQEERERSKKSKPPHQLPKSSRFINCKDCEMTKIKLRKWQEMIDQRKPEPLS